MIGAAWREPISPSVITITSDASAPKSLLEPRHCGTRGKAAAEASCVGDLAGDVDQERSA